MKLYKEPKLLSIVIGEFRPVLFFIAGCYEVIL